MNVEDLIKIPKVLGVGLVSNDGFIIGGEAKFEYNIEKLGAMTARIINRIHKNLHIQKPSVIIYTTDKVILVRDTDEGIVFVICQKNANVGLLKIKIDTIS